MDNQRKLHVIMDLLSEVTARRGEAASNDQIGTGLATAMGNLLIACARMSVEGQADGDQADDGFDDEPHGSRDTFVPHPCDEYYVIRHNAAEDDERFNAMQD